MAPQTSNEYPAVSGLLWHRDRYYSFFIPSNWHKFLWTDDRQGTIYGPDPSDPFTVLAVDSKDLGTTITADDLDVLAEGFFESIEQLPACAIESRSQNRDLLQLEAKYTFREQNAFRKRWVRLFYFETRQIAMTAQGATLEKYDYWLPWFFEAMMTTRIHNTEPQIDIGD